jgi:signal transduction histidine kinase
VTQKLLKLKNESPRMTLRNRRVWLWALLFFIAIVLLSLLVWLVGRYEKSRLQDQLEISVSDISTDIRSRLTRHMQRMQVLMDRNETTWLTESRQFLESENTILRLERRSSSLQVQSIVNTPFLKQASPEGIFLHLDRGTFIGDVTLACISAAHVSEPSFSNSYFVPASDGTGYQVTDMCLPSFENGKPVGYLVVTYSLERIIKEWGATNLKQNEELSLREADGSRLAVGGHSQPDGGHLLSAATVLNLRGNKLVLHLTSTQSTPYWLDNTPTAVALLLILALSGVLWLLYRDTRKRHQMEAALAHEIAQQRKAEEVSRQSLERLQKSARLATLGEMASMMSHELNQPLAAITSYASGSLHLLANPAQGESAQSDILQIKTALERIASQSERASLVIKSVHNFVRRRETEHAFIAPHALFDSVLPLIGLQAKQTDVRLEIHTAKGLPLVWCDKTLIEQVLINLSRNGIQAMGSPGNNQRCLTLSASLYLSSSERQVEFKIQDTGTGLSPDVADKLFTQFFTTKAEGMGLGLSLCRTVIEQHGSSLAYTTRTGHPDSGTIFSFKLKTDRYADLY